MLLAFIMKTYIVKDLFKPHTFTLIFFIEFPNILLHGLYYHIFFDFSTLEFIFSYYCIVLLGVHCWVERLTFLAIM